VERASQG
jgi:hypothetical protein